MSIFASRTLGYSAPNVAGGPFRIGSATAVTAPEDMAPGATALAANGGQITLLIHAQR